MGSLRRGVTLAVGAAVGASAAFYLDPESGSQRRRDALRRLADGARDRQARTVDLQRLGASAAELAGRAAAAYQDELARRAEPGAAGRGG